MQCGQGKPFTVTSTNSRMGGAAVRSYKEGGIVEGSNPNIDEDTRERARQFVADGGTQVSASPNKSSSATSKVVTKEQLQAFKTKYGADKDLTDYMNAQQGLTRRTPSGPPRADYSNEGKGDSKYRKQTMTPESQALERVYPEQYLAMPGIKGIAAVAKNLADRGATTGAKEVAKRIEPTMFAKVAAKRIEPTRIEPTMYARGKK